MGQINFPYIIFLEKLTPTKELFILVDNKESLEKFHKEMKKVYAQEEGKKSKTNSRKFSLSSD